LVLLTRHEDSFAKARAERLKYSENPRRYDNLGVFIDEQCRLRAMLQQTSLISTEIDVTDRSDMEVAEDVLDWVESSGGMWR
jgi:hypothetical protein